MNFDRTAGWYDALAKAVFGNRVLHAQKCYLGDIPDGADVLIIGGGTGEILPDLLARNPGHVTYYEKSAAMMLKAKQRLPGEQSGKIDWVLADSISLTQIGRKYDVIITFFLFSNYRENNAFRIWSEVDGCLKPGGVWLFADFIGNNRQSRLQRITSYVLTAFFRMVAGVEVEKIPGTRSFFAGNGYREAKTQDYFHRYIEALLFIKKA